jgi:hypothetical protein
MRRRWHVHVGIFSGTTTSARYSAVIASSDLYELNWYTTTDDDASIGEMIRLIVKGNGHSQSFVPVFRPQEFVDHFIVVAATIGPTSGAHLPGRPLTGLQFCVHDVSLFPCRLLAHDPGIDGIVRFEQPGG